MSDGQTMHHETDKCGCVYVVGSGDFAGDPDDKKLSIPCGEHEQRTPINRRLLKNVGRKLRGWENRKHRRRQG